MPRRIGLSVSEWPVRDREAWSRAVEPASFFDEDAVAARWRPKTRQQAVYAHGRWLAYLRDKDPELLDLPPVTRDTPERVHHYVETLALRLTAMSVAAELQHLSLAFRALSPTCDWSWLRKWQYAFQKQARPREKRHKIIDPRRLVALGLKLMDGADCEACPAERARRYRDGLLIALLASRPLRRRSLGALEIGTSLRHIAGRYVIQLRDDDTKAALPLEFDVPDVLGPYLARYLEKIRPMFPHAAESQALWLSSKGGALRDNAIYGLVCKRTKKAFGFSIHPHLFRDIAATAIARETPEQLAIARDLLAHSKIEMTDRHYMQARSAEAARAHAALLARLQRDVPKP